MKEMLVDRPPDAGERPIGRRALFTSGAAVAAMYSTMMERKAAAANDVSADVDPSSLTSKLVDRITLGATPADRQLAADMGYEDYLEYQLNQVEDNSACDNEIETLYPLTALATPKDMYDAEIQINVHIDQLVRSTIHRSVCSKHQLFERVTEFWVDHFNSFIRSGGVGYFKIYENREAVRANAMTNVNALVTANARSAAMLSYLNQAFSGCPFPNENYARELLELHVLGVNGGYTEDDVVQVARCFTGWSYDSNTNNAGWGLFLYRNNLHCTGSKTVLNTQIHEPGNPELEGNRVIDLIVGENAASDYIAGKLSRWFLGEDCRQSIVDEVASVYRCTNGNVKAMIRAILQPNNVYDAPRRFKRPYHHFASAMRSVGATFDQMTGVSNSLRLKYVNAGQEPYYWGPPDGYPDTFDFWNGFVLPRWSFGATLANDSIAGVTYDVNAFYDNQGSLTADQVLDIINAKLFDGRLPQCERDELRAYLPPDPILPNLQQRRDVLGLAIGSPAFQWY